MLKSTLCLNAFVAQIIISFFYFKLENIRGLLSAVIIQPALTVISPSYIVNINRPIQKITTRKIPCNEIVSNILMCNGITQPYDKMIFIKTLGYSKFLID